MPQEGWDDEQIMLLIRDLALMDSNIFADNMGVGEREGRIFSNIVKQKYFCMAQKYQMALAVVAT
jgi:O-phospho-L-seryl-tRNASec:L-selenocysteinyl-tRNA synthase